jgi:hypothetical protein
MLSELDVKELEHIRDGGSWCLDGRKGRRLSRLNYIETKKGWFGWYITQIGLDALAQREASNE